jgi:hypothetical protein
MASAEELLGAHDKAQAHLEVKMRPVFIHTLARKKHPTIIDIYEGNDNLFTRGVPHHLSCPFIFSNYNSLAAMGFRADAPTDNPALVKAIWYWGMDRDHSFNFQWRSVRINLILATFVLANHQKGLPTSGWVSDDALPFVMQFYQAWCATLLRGSSAEDYSFQEKFSMIGFKATMI